MKIHKSKQSRSIKEKEEKPDAEKSTNSKHQTSCCKINKKVQRQQILSETSTTSEIGLNWQQNKIKFISKNGEG